MLINNEKCEILSLYTKARKIVCILPETVSLMNQKYLIKIFGKNSFVIGKIKGNNFGFLKFIKKFPELLIEIKDAFKKVNNNKYPKKITFLTKNNIKKEISFYILSNFQKMMNQKLSKIVILIPSNN